MITWSPSNPIFALLKCKLWLCVTYKTNVHMHIPMHTHMYMHTDALNQMICHLFSDFPFRIQFSMTWEVFCCRFRFFFWWLFYWFMIFFLSNILGYSLVRSSLKQIASKQVHNLNNTTIKWPGFKFLALWLKSKVKYLL